MSKVVNNIRLENFQTSSEAFFADGGSWKGGKSEFPPSSSNNWAEIIPNKAIDYWRSKSPLTASEFERLTETEKLRAFTAANIEDARHMQKIYDTIDKCISDGISIKKAKEELLKKVPISEHQADTILRTNIFSAYSAGRYSEIQASKKNRPYLRYSAVLDGRTRPSHSMLHGKIYPADDPFWSVNFPPNGYNCRCDVVSLSERQVQNLGLEIAKTPKGKNPFALSKDFARNPQDIYKPVLDKYNPLVRQRYIENIVNYANSDLVQVSKLLNQEDLELAETIMKSQKCIDSKVFADYIDSLLKDKTTAKDLAIIGNFPYRVLRYLKSINNSPLLALTAIHKNELFHAVRQAKEARGQALTIDEIKQIPEKFISKDTRWFYDTKEKNVVMAFLRYGNEYLKVVFNINRKVGKGIANTFTTAGKINELNLEIKDKNGNFIYDEIK